MGKTEKILLVILAIVTLIVVVMVGVIYLPGIIEKSQTLPPH